MKNSDSKVYQVGYAAELQESGGSSAKRAVDTAVEAPAAKVNSIALASTPPPKKQLKFRGSGCHCGGGDMVVVLCM